MINKPLLSIVIPTYKGEESLCIALESICNQTYKNIEVLVSDDNGAGTESQKRTEQIVNKYSNKLDIKYIINEHINASHARNEGFKRADGEYISFLDDDDFYLETYAEDVINAKGEFDILFFDTVILHEKHIYRKISSPSINSKSLVFYEQEIGTGSNICVKKRIKNEGMLFDERYLRHQDIEFVAKVLKKYKHKWINKINIIKYYNNIDNYPTVETALSMQRLLRDDMLENNIINSIEYNALMKKQLHGLLNDYLVKEANMDEINFVYSKLKDLNSLSKMDKCINIIYRRSRKLFIICFNMYSRFNKQANGKKDIEKYLNYRKRLEKEANI